MMRNVITFIKNDLNIIARITYIWRSGMDTCGRVKIHNGVICIIIHKDQSYEDIVRTLAHELRHVWQYEQHHLEDVGNGLVRWKTKYYIDTDVEPEYYNLPWEVDAYEYEDTLWSKLGATKN